MRLAFRFGLRSLLIGSSLLAGSGGGARWWYDRRLAEYERQQRVAVRLQPTKAAVLWTYTGPSGFGAWKALDGPLFRRPTHAYCDAVVEGDFADVVNDLAQLDLATLVVLARQIVPHAEAAKSLGADPVIAALRGHRTLKQLVVDASIRGAPLAFDAPLYTRKDLALLKEVLPELKVVWIEVN